MPLVEVPPALPPPVQCLPYAPVPDQLTPKSREKSLSISTMAAWISTSSTGLSRSAMTLA